MPLVRIDLVRGMPAGHRKALGEAVYDTLVEVLNVPKNDRFQIIAEHPEENFVYDPTYLGVQRSCDCVFIQITLNAGRSVDMKKAFYAQLAKNLELRVGLRPEDVFISLVEVPKENWSFGNGEAQYAT